MPQFRTKPRNVEAVRLTQPLTISAHSDGGDLGNPAVDGTAISVSAGDWLVTHEDGGQEFMADSDFTAEFEPIIVPRRGRPPKGDARESASVPKRKRRRSRKRAKAKEDRKAAA